ncbi:hypothetical protein [Zavarzinia sp.]|uniref:hypothetical protein n=1 Tax=Zavarzinia sp. TaxID=2027920 RepID=UPI003BB73114|nr:hypothetical protein [Zavarzinia sp.]
MAKFMLTGIKEIQQDAMDDKDWHHRPGSLGEIEKPAADPDGGKMTAQLQGTFQIRSRAQFMKAAGLYQICSNEYFFHRRGTL